jgi:hypothetical protein
MFSSFILICLLFLSSLCNLQTAVKVGPKKEETCYTKVLKDITPDEKAATNYAMHLTSSERVFLWRYLQKSRNYFEFGASGASILACKSTPVKKLEIIDNDQRRLNFLRNVSSCFRENLDPLSSIDDRKELILKFVDTGPIDSIGTG